MNYILNLKTIFINYTKLLMRVFVFETIFKSEKLGDFENGSVNYMKGIYNNCSCY